MLEIRDLEVSYNKSKIIQGVSLTINQGDKVCLLGKNGVGKTTFLKGIMGIEVQGKGEILFEGQDIARIRTNKRSKRGIAYVPQGREIFPQLTVRENLIIGCLMHSPKSVDSLINEVLEYFPALHEHLNRKGGVLSGGQQQQLAIARAMISKPKILLLDEPSEGIQPNIVAEISEIINRINREHKISILLIEQNLDFAYKTVDKYFVMEKGKIIASGQLEEQSLEKVKEYLTI